MSPRADRSTRKAKSPALEILKDTSLLTLSFSPPQQQEFASSFEDGPMVRSKRVSTVIISKIGEIGLEPNQSSSESAFCEKWHSALTYFSLRDTGLESYMMEWLIECRSIALVTALTLSSTVAFAVPMPQPK